MPTIIENPTSVQEQYSHHLVVDGANGVPASAVTHDFMENLLGHRSGAGNTTPWATALTRPLPGVYQDADSQGSGAAFAATTLTDAARAWGVGDFNVGGTVTYGANTLTDTARNNANAWVVANTAQYAGRVVRTITGKLGIISSVALGVITLTANWQGGTPAASEQYAFMPLGLVGRTIFAVGTGGAITKGVILFHIGTVATITAWSNGTPAGGAAYIIGPDALAGTPPPTKFSDNWWATLRMIFNPANL
jgi:hypothetical protein